MWHKKGEAPRLMAGTANDVFACAMWNAEMLTAANSGATMVTVKVQSLHFSDTSNSMKDCGCEIVPEPKKERETLYPWV